MNTRPIEQARTPDLRDSWPALQRAARRAREIAAQTGTALVVTRNGVIEHLYPQPQAPVPTVQEVKPPYETGS
ncbi:MAG: hypothetical protein WAV22_04780 [Porticoccaceae bacterium]